MPTNRTLDDSAQEELQRLRTAVEVGEATRRFWERVLTPEDQRLLGSFDAAFKTGGTIAVWSSLRGTTAERAIVDVALSLNLTDATTANWLLRELGESPIEAPNPSNDEAPSWGKESRELRYRGRVIRRILRPNQARNIVLLLDEFQKAGWPLRIDDPLPDGPDPERLRKTIGTLNTGLDVIVFYADGTGQGIGWRPI